MSVDYADLRLADEYWCCGSLEYKNAKETRLGDCFWVGVSPDNLTTPRIYMRVFAVDGSGESSIIMKPCRNIMTADLRENNSKLVLELQAGAGSAASHSTITMRRDQSTGANQFQRMHKIADAVQDLCAQPKLFAIVSGKTVPDDVLESMKNPHATPGAWRTKSPSKASHYQKLPQPPKGTSRGSIGGSQRAAGLVQVAKGGTSRFTGMSAAEYSPHHPPGLGKRRRAASPEGPLVLGGGEAIPQLGALRREGKFCDVTVRVGDQSFPAHRVVLSAQSMFLAALFASGLKDSASTEVELKELEPSVFALVMDFMYDGTCTVPSASTLEPVLAAASLLQVDSLMSAAAAELETQLTPGNCVRALACADRHHLPQLAARAEAVAAGAFVEAASDASMPVSSLRALLQSDALNVKTEQEVYETLSTWLKNQAVPLSEEAERDLFSLVRLPLLPKPFIQSTVMEEAALSTVQGYKLLLTQLLGPTPAKRRSWQMSDGGRVRWV